MNQQADNQLDAWFENIQASGKLHDQQIADFNQQLKKHTPLLFTPNNNGGGRGYWRIEKGIVSYQQWPNGDYDRYSLIFYEEEFIQQLFSMLKSEPIKENT